MGIAATTPQAIRFHDHTAVICSELMQRLVTMAERVARGNAAVLITGETGSGKELIARAIHHHSLRCSKPWIDVNCAALPDNLVESELFGYEKGAFSGADTAKPGLFELADKGTLFLDEIGELEPKVQVKLLRVLDGVPYYRLGGSRKVSVDVRIVTATNVSLDEAVRHGRFRSDLFHRISHVQLRVPPLRERPDDIVALANFFLAQSHPNMRLSREALDKLLAYPWPGNIRELRNVIVGVATLHEGTELRAIDLPAEITSGRPATAGPLPIPAHDITELDDMEKQAILRALERVGGHQGMAADQLGISRRTLSRKLKQYHLESAPATAPAAPLGKLSDFEQQYFRARLDVPAKISTSEAQLLCKVLNVSAGGVAIEGVREPLRLARGFTISFTIPGIELKVESKGQLVWAEGQGRAGVRFLDLAPDVRRELTSWLAQKQKEEGWQIA
jgi:transcriptional regulator with PAS, ATPase and Fis domain